MIYPFLESYDKPLEEETFLTDIIKKFYTFSMYYYKDKHDKRTIYLRLRNVEGFEKFLHYQYPNIRAVKDIDEVHINAFKEFCYKGLKNDRKTINSKLTSLKYFFKYLTHEGYIEYNLVLNVNKMKCIPNEYPTIFKISDLKILFSQMRRLKFGIRDIVISKIVLTTGIDIKDILSLKIDSINLESREISFNSTIYPIGNELLKDLNEYLIIREEINTQHSRYLFLSSVGTVYSIRSYQVAFKRAITDTSIPVNLTPRNLKMTFIYNMAKVTNEEGLRSITGQNKVEHYYKLLENPLQTII